MTNTDRLLILIPTFNEKENIGKLIPAIFSSLQREVDVLIIDDNSPDGSGKLVGELTRQYPRVSLMQRPGRGGLASAYIEGFTYALAKGFSMVACMDADFSHDPSYLNEFLRALQAGADVAMGSRYVEGGRVENWGEFRKLLSAWGNRYARWVLQVPIRDLTSGFRCFRSSILQKINYRGIRAKGYSFQIEFTYQVYTHGFAVKEVPIVFTDRVAGASKLSKTIILEALLHVWRLRRGSSWIVPSGGPHDG